MDEKNVIKFIFTLLVIFSTCEYYTFESLPSDFEYRLQEHGGMCMIAKNVLFGTPENQYVTLRLTHKKVVNVTCPYNNTGGSIRTKKDEYSWGYYGADIQIVNIRPGVVPYFELYDNWYRVLQIRFENHRLNRIRFTASYRDTDYVPERFTSSRNIDLPFNHNDGFHHYGIAFEPWCVRVYVDNIIRHQDCEYNHKKGNPVERLEFNGRVQARIEVHGDDSIGYYTFNNVSDESYMYIRDMHFVDYNFSYWAYVASPAAGLVILVPFVLIYLCICVYGCCGRKLLPMKNLTIPGEVTKRIEKGKSTLEMMNEIDLQDGIDNIAKLNVKKELFTIDIDELQIKKSIGAGGFCKVYLCEWNDVSCAFKCFDTKMIGESKDNFEDFESELSLVSSLSHPNIPQFFGATLKPPRVGLVIEYCPNGNIREYIEKNSISLKERMKLMKQCCHGMNYIHSKSIIHRDLKPENILVSETKTAKIIDFGLSRMTTRLKEKKTQRVGTSFYMAPEVTLGTDYGAPADVFSFGIILWCVTTESFTPYGDGSTSSFSVETRVANDPNFRPNIEIVKSDFIAEMIKRCWVSDPERRPTFKELYKEIDYSKV